MSGKRCKASTMPFDTKVGVRLLNREPAAPPRRTPDLTFTTQPVGSDPSIQPVHPVATFRQDAAVHGVNEDAVCPCWSALGYLSTEKMVSRGRRRGLRYGGSIRRAVIAAARRR